MRDRVIKAELVARTKQADSGPSSQTDIGQTPGNLNKPGLSIAPEIVMFVRPLRRISSFINDATDIARGVRKGIFGYPFRHSLSNETLKLIFLLVDELTRDEWDQKLETEQEIIYLGLSLSHVCRQWRRVALRTPALWAGIRICQSELPDVSTVTLPKSTRHFLRYSSPLLLYLTLSAENHRILGRLPAQRVRSLVIYGTLEAIYDASKQWTTQFPVLEDLIVEVSPLPPPVYGVERETPIVVDNFFNFFPFMTWLTLRNVNYIQSFQPIATLRRLTWTMDPQCEMESTSFAAFHHLTDIRYLELDVPNLRGGSFRIARPLEEVVFKNVGTTTMNALNRAFPPNLTSLTITSSEDIIYGLLEFLEEPRGERIRKFSLSLVDVRSVVWYQILRRVPNVETLELGLTPTLTEPDPLTELLDALALHQGNIILVPRLSELRLAGDVLSRIERVADFLRVREVESEMARTQWIGTVEMLVLPTGYFTMIPEPLAWELESLVAVLADAALNRLVEPMF